jgi:hypothetical protein
VQQSKTKNCPEKKETVFLEGGMYVQLAHRLFLSLCVCVCACLQSGKQVSESRSLCLVGSFRWRLILSLFVLEGRSSIDMDWDCDSSDKER